MSKSQRDKGAKGEREVCSVVQDLIGVSARRKLGQARDSGNDIDLGPFTVEVKRRKAIAVYDWIEQASAAGDKPVVVCRADGKPWLVIQPFEDWLALAREEIVK